MMFGSFFWGSYSDTKGRKLPYTMTLVITSVFGVLSSFAFSFWSLCLLLFFLGFGVGGNMPTDGALYLEFLPKEYHYLLTFMSVFFSFGAVLASILGYLILPYSSCPESTIELPFPDCDVTTQNNGWRIMLFSVGIATIIMLIARSFCLKLPETPKFLMNHNKHKETIIVLQDIAKMNGNSHIDIQASDLVATAKADRDNKNSDEEEDNTNEYDGLLSAHDRNDDNMDHNITSTHRRLSNEYQLNGSSSSQSPISIVVEKEEELANSLNAYTILWSPKWRKTILLIWGIWMFTSMAYTMFNVFLPKYLETLGFEGESTPSRKDVYWDYMIYSMAGVPGSVMASYLIETRLGRKGTMAASSFGSAIALFLFSIIKSRVTMLISSSSVSFLATLLYAVIYGYTPEVFDTVVRGTAVGTASGLGRVAGIVSPILSGILLTFSTTLPLYVSVIGFALVGVFIVLLPYETRNRNN
ncbi:major facilitator superfamily domain-containing protein [Cunninghamella echinulata]|nr:major facilitator superfamily domain-containing protein [Cunninghamella echinulata]